MSIKTIIDKDIILDNIFTFTKQSKYLLYYFKYILKSYKEWSININNNIKKELILLKEYSGKKAFLISQYSSICNAKFFY